MPQLPVKIKEENMDQRKLLMELEEAFDRLSCVLNAVTLMALGLENAQSPYADGLCVVTRYLEEAAREVQKCLKAVSDAGSAA